MKNRAVLNVYPVTDADGIDIAAQHRVEPDAAFVADDRVADNRGVVCQKTVFADLRSETAYRFY